ncbi:MAG: hypothetical protein IKK22_05915 [Firmicutes bacterium]|nr:hypothetical protein [Bacillota bacterium]
MTEIWFKVLFTDTGETKQYGFLAADDSPASQAEALYRLHRTLADIGRPWQVKNTTAEAADFEK